MNVDIIDIPVHPAYQPIRWLRSLDEIDDHAFDQFAAIEEIYDSFKKNAGPFRDWNEEMQSFKKAEAQDFYEQINKGKIHEKIQQDFLEAALEGAKSIVEGRLGALNVSSQQSDKCFIHNNIFYTFCSQEPLGLSQIRGDEAPSTSIMASIDMDNTKLLEGIDGKSIHSVQTALIFYRGYCVTAQSLIQGILYYDEQTWTKYGSINDGKTIVADDEFKAVISEISARFHAKDDLVFVDKDGQHHQLASSVDVKGIKAGDGRKYVLDLFRMSPRDLNWEGTDFDALVFKPKLVESYIYHMKLEASEGIRQKYLARLAELKQQQQEILVKISNEREKKKEEKTSEESEIKEDKPTEVTEENTELTTKLTALREEVQKVHTTMSKEIEEEITKKKYSDCRFDTSLFSGMESFYEDKAAEETEKEKLKKLATFAKEKMVKNFVDEWSRMTKAVPVDTQTLVNALRGYGLNSRYLGYVLQILDPQSHMKHILLTKRAIVVRCLSHLLNHVLSCIPYLQISDTISHLLNCAVGSKDVQSFLESKVKNLNKAGDNKQGEDQDTTGEGSKKKKKKKQKKVQQVKTDLEPNTYMIYSPTDLFKEMKKIAEIRYKHTFTEKNFNDLTFLGSEADRLSFLREICLSIGLCLGFRDFNFGTNVSISSMELPIKPSDIGEFLPIVKKNDAEFLHTKENYAIGASLIASGKYDKAVEIFNSNLQALLNVDLIDEDLWSLSPQCARVCYNSCSPIRNFR